MLSILKDPWKLLVLSLAIANVIAAVAVVMMFRNKSDAAKAASEMHSMLHPEQDASIYEELTKIKAIRALKEQSGLENTDQFQVSDFIVNAAKKSALKANTSYSAASGRDNTTDHKFTVTFEAGKEGIDRRNLSLFLFRIKTLTPQIKIISINSGGSKTKHEDADQWKPTVTLVLTKDKPDPS